MPPSPLGFPNPGKSQKREKRTSEPLAGTLGVLSIITDSGNPKAFESPGEEEEGARLAEDEWMAICFLCS